MSRGRVWLLLAAGVWGCAGGIPQPAAPLTEPARLCRDPTPSRACRTMEEVEGWLRDPELRIMGSADTHEGRQGARILTLSVPRDGEVVVFRAKWRAHDTMSTNNTPRYELAAHAVQKLFLQPHQLAAPPSDGHCFELNHYRERVDLAAQPSFKGISCAFGVLSYWLEDVISMDDAKDSGLVDSGEGLLDDGLFGTNEVYRRSISDVNLLTVLISHGDTHPAQFVVADGAGGPRVYSIDNSLSFLAPKNPKLPELLRWYEVRVPAFSKESVDRLAALSPGQLRRLAVVAQYENQAGRLLWVEPAEPQGNLGEGLRWIDRRKELQVGLTLAEINGLAARLRGIVEGGVGGPRRVNW